MPYKSLDNHYFSKIKSSKFNILRIEDLFDKELHKVFTKNHKVDFFTLLIITDNIGRHSIDYKDFYFTKGTILAIRKDQIHKFYNNKDVKGYLVFFKEDFLNAYLNELEISKTIQMFNELLTSPKTQLTSKDFKNVSILLKKIENEIYSVNDQYSLKVVRSLLHILITLIHRLKSKGHNKVQLKKYLKEFIVFQNHLESDCFNTKSVSDYALKMGFSSKKLNMISRYIANKSAKMFIDDVFITKVKSLLLKSSLSAKEVAFKVGFKDPANFYKYFKKHTNHTPEQFRKINSI